MNAQAIILAAGRGERMRPLTDHTPKPLLQVGGKPLMQWPMEALARGGFTQLVINTAWLGEQIADYFGANWPPQATPLPLSPLSITYSHEGRDFGGALETAGGIARALPLLDEVFWVLAGDVFAPDFVFSPTDYQRFARSGKLAHIWLVPNPPHNLKGDFGIAPEVTGSASPGLALSRADVLYTYSTIGLYRRAFFDTLPYGNPAGLKAPLAPLLRAAMAQGQVSAQMHLGSWTDVGTPQRLAQLNETLSVSK